jgi:peroxiredoxin
LSAVRETLADFHALDTEVFGINEADAASHQKFIDHLELTFDLLVDEGLAVAEAYDALKPEGGRIERTVVIVGKNGRIVFRAQGAPPPAELLAEIKSAADS